MSYSMKDAKNRALYDSCFRLAVRHRAEGLTVEQIAESDVWVEELLQDSAVQTACGAQSRDWVKKRVKNLRKDGKMFTLADLPTGD